MFYHYIVLCICQNIDHLSFSKSPNDIKFDKIYRKMYHVCNIISILLEASWSVLSYYVFHIVEVAIFSGNMSSNNWNTLNRTYTHLNWILAPCNHVQASFSFYVFLCVLPLCQNIEHLSFSRSLYIFRSVSSYNGNTLNLHTHI
jgi:hypothetical protein